MLSKLEIKRQLFHLFLGLLLVFLYYFDFINVSIVFVIVVLGGLLCFLAKKTKIPVISFFLRHFEREEQRDIFPGKGPFFFFIGVLLVMGLFEKNIALASMMILALGDSLSHLIGAYFGKTKNIFNSQSRKLLEGTVFGTIAGFLGALVFVSSLEAFLGSLGAMSAEALELKIKGKTIDDNLVVPLVAGIIIFLVRILRLI